MFPQAGPVPPGYVLVYLDHQLQWIHPNHVVSNGRPSENEEGESVSVSHGTDEERHTNYVSQSGVPIAGMHQVPVYPVMPPINNVFVAPPTHGAFPRYMHPYSLYGNTNEQPVTTSAPTTTTTASVQNSVRRGNNKSSKNEKSSNDTQYTEYESANGEVTASALSSGAALTYLPQHPGMAIGAIPSPYSYSYYAPTASASISAQHATGTPLYIPSVYQPAAIFSPSFLYHENPASVSVSSVAENNNKINSSNSSDYTSLKITEYVEPSMAALSVPKSESVAKQETITDVKSNDSDNNTRNYVKILTNTTTTTTTTNNTNDLDEVAVGVSEISVTASTNNSTSVGISKTGNEVINKNEAVKCTDTVTVNNSGTTAVEDASTPSEIKPTRILGPKDNASKFFPKQNKDQRLNNNNKNSIRDPAIILEVKKCEVISRNNHADTGEDSTNNIETKANELTADDDKQSNELSSSSVVIGEEKEVFNGSDENTSGVNEKSSENTNEDVDKSSDNITVASEQQISDSTEEIKPKFDKNGDLSSSSSSSIVNEPAHDKDANKAVPTSDDKSSKEVKEPEAEQQPQQPVVKTWAGLFKNYPGKTTTVGTKSAAGGNNGTKLAAELFQNSISHTAAPNENCFDVTQPINLPSFNTRIQSKSQSSSFPNNNKTSKLNSSSVTSYAAPTSSPLDEMYLRRIGEFLKGYILDHRAVNFDLHGLINRGNRCYMNATIQALIACPPFFNLMRNLAQHIIRSNKGRCSPYALRTHMPIIDTVTQIVVEFTNLNRQKKHNVQKGEGIQEVTSATSLDLLAINKLLSAIQNSDTFVMGEQEDAQEFLTCLLNGLNDEMLELIQLTDGFTLAQIRDKSNFEKSIQISNGDVGSEADDDSEWKEVQTKNKAAIIHRQNLRPTPLSEIFRGQLRSKLQKAGDLSTNNIEPFFTLHLNIEKVQTVKEALELMVGRDVLEGVTSSKTNQEVDAWQQQTLEELPCVLLLHLKCFDYKNHSCSKILKTIEFPIDLRIDTKIMSQNAMRNRPMFRYRQYKLFAVVYHDGKEATKGHYITDVFHVGYAGWLRYDDAKVYAVDEKDVLKPKLPRMPYLLYYRRCDTIAALMQPPFVNK